MLSDGSIVYSEVKSFLDKQSAPVSMYKSITTSNNKTITLSGSHLIYARKTLDVKFIPM